MDRVDRNFFVIDSTGLDETADAFYGFTYIDHRFVRDLQDVDFSKLSGEGTYVAVERKENEVVLWQDFCGSYGIYLYDDGKGFFAFSNSFLYLVEYLVKNNRKFTVNKDYMSYYTVLNLCSSANGQTPVNEIQMLDRSVKVHIDLADRTYSQEKLDYHENTIWPDTKEGLEILDDWFERWTALFRDIRSETSSFVADLSGGFDSRISFALVLKSGVPLDRMCVCSIKNDQGTHKEDRRIAAEMGEAFGFTLNDWSFYSAEKTPFTVKEMMAGSFYPKLFFHKKMYYKNGWWNEPRYQVTGHGGECIRGYWMDMNREQFIKKQKDYGDRYSDKGDNQLADGVSRLMEESLKKTDQKFQELGYKLKEEEIVQSHYRETRNRNHFGKNRVENYFANEIILTPLLDSRLHMLKLNTLSCTDYDFLYALILTRFAPELLKFEFEGGRELQQKTLSEAKKVCECYPFERKPFEPLTEETAKNRPSKFGKLPYGAQDANAIVTSAFFNNNVELVSGAELSSSAYSRIKEKCEKNGYSSKGNLYALLGNGKTEIPGTGIAQNEDLYALLGLEKLVMDMTCPGPESLSFIDHFEELSRQTILREKYNSPDESLRVQKVSPADMRITRCENSAEGIILSWLPVSDADAYTVYRHNHGKWEKAASVPDGDTSTFIDRQVEKDCWGKVYVYYIAACMKGDEISRTEGVTIQRLAEPVITRVESGFIGNLKVSWNILPEINKSSGYRLEYAETAGDLENRTGTYKQQEVEGREVMSAEIKGLVSSRTIYVRAAAWVLYRKGTPSEVKSFSAYSPIVSLQMSPKLRLPRRTIYSID